MNRLSALLASTALILAPVAAVAQTLIPATVVQTANPSATIGLTAVNGTAGTVMTSDSAPALSQSITPTWLNLHIFNGGARFPVGTAAAPPVNATGDTTTGFYPLGSGTWGFASQGGADIGFTPVGIRQIANNVYCWSAFGTITSCDTGVSRLSAGIVAFGTGAAASTAGGWQAATGQVGSGTALTLAAGEIGFNKITASGTAPGASGVKEEWVCGTNAGTAKKIAYAGTSTTPVTIVDNVGSGVTGC